MASILISVMIFALLGVWGVGAHIREFGEFPSLGKVFSLPMKKIDKRAYVFFVVAGGILFLSGVLTIGDYYLFKDLVLESVGDISLVLVYVSLLINYLIRLKIYIKTNDIRSKIRREFYVWDVIWGVGVNHCKQSSDRRNLLISNYAIVFFVLIYIVWVLVA